MSIQQNYGNIKPSLNLDFANTKQLDPRITYSRASTGTYYDGKAVAKAEENLLLQSQAIGTTGWIQNNSTPTLNNAIAPDGTTTASLITLTSAGNLQTYQLTPTLTGQITMSCYIKTGSITWIQFFYGGVNTEYASFNVSSGTLGNYSGTATITSVGNGWYRCTHTFTPPTNISTVTINTVDSGTAARAASPTFSSGTWYLWGAQLEQRSFATAYTPTTTAPITNYIPVLQTASAGTPRFDHNPITGESLGLLIEEQRTNLLLRSQEFDSADWTKVNTSVTANTIVAPDGTLTADKLVEDTVNTTHRVLISSAVVVPTNSPSTVSLYAKAAERTAIRLTDNDIQGADVDLLTGTVSNLGSGVTATATSVGNGWWRVAVTRTSSTANGRLVAYLVSGGSTTYTGNGVSGIYIWGAQLEAGAFATSYIPTVASQVTRAADSASMTGTNFARWYNVNEGTIYASASTASVATNSSIYAFTDSLLSSINSIYGNSGAQNHLVVRINNSTVANLNGGTFTSGVNGNSAGAYKLNDFAVSVNGGVSTTDDTGVVPVVDRLFLGASVNGVTFGSQTIKRIAYYPRRLTNTQLQALTS